MPITEPYPSLDELLENAGVAGQRLAAFDASEGAAGNISMLIGWPMEVRRHFPHAEPLSLPDPAPALAGTTLLVTGSGRRLRDVREQPVANLGAVVIDDDGRKATLHTATARLFEHVTSEFNSHVAVHADAVKRTGTNFSALVHAQPPHLVYLSHVPAYREARELNRRLLRWQPETIVNLPRGIGVLPFLLPGSPELMEATLDSLRTHRMVLWSKHGVMARSDRSVTRAVDRIEYAETAAMYECMDLAHQERGEGLTPEELKAVVEAFDVETDLV